ncbi:MAG: hypothetical protein KJ767_03525 [Nanoarchaeota archaeon]|nr:hypothetical protein [Nanoarchaeota archaeon]
MPAPTKLVLEMQKTGMNDGEIIRRLREQGYTDKDVNDAFNQARVKQSIRSDEFSEVPDAPMPSQRSPQEPTRMSGMPQGTPRQMPEQGMNEFVPGPSQYPEQNEQEYDYGQQQDYNYYPETQPEQQEQQQYESEQEYPGYEQGYTTEAFEEIAESIIEERWRAFMEKIGDVQGWKERVDREIDRIEKRIDKIDNSLMNIHAAMLEKVNEYGKGVKDLGTDVKAMERAFSGIMQPLMKHSKEVKSAADKVEKHRAKKNK